MEKRAKLVFYDGCRDGKPRRDAEKRYATGISESFLRFGVEILKKEKNIYLFRF
jgi:hypothetical protein